MTDPNRIYLNDEYKLTAAAKSADELLLDDSGLSRRAVNSLKRKGFVTFGDVINFFRLEYIQTTQSVLYSKHVIEEIIRVAKQKGYI